MQARIISIENPAAKPIVNPECTHYLHSKFIRRKQHVTDVLLPQIKRVGFDAEIFAAITQEHFTVENGQAVYGDVRLTIGEGVVGNLLSHLMLWRSCRDPLLILEDDAALPPKNERTIVQAVGDFASYSNPAVMHLLSAIPSSEFGVKRFGDVSQVGGLLKLNSAGDLSGTAAYCVNPTGAAVLARAAKLYATVPTDGFIHRAFERGEIDVVVPVNHGSCFMLHEHFAEWNHVHNG